MKIKFSKIAFLILLFFLSSFIYSQVNYYYLDNGHRIDLDSELYKCKEMSNESMVFYLDLMMAKCINKVDSIFIFKQRIEPSRSVNYMAMKTHLDRDNAIGMNLDALLDHLGVISDKPLIVNFSFSKCPPCRREIRIIDSLYRLQKNQFDFIIITPETNTLPLQELFKEPIKVYSIPDLNIKLLYIVKAYPKTYITDRKHNVILILDEIKPSFFDSFLHSQMKKCGND